MNPQHNLCRAVVPRPHCHVATCSSRISTSRIHNSNSHSNSNRSCRTTRSLPPRSVLLLFSILLLSVTHHFHDVEGKIDRNAPHIHRGKLPPYTPGPFLGLTLTSDDEMTLERGEPVMKQTLPADSSSSGGTAICVQDVQAPVIAVWAQILHMEEYPKKVNKVLKCENYHVAPTHDTNNKNAAKKIRIKTKQVLGVLPGYSVRVWLCLCIHV